MDAIGIETGRNSWKLVHIKSSLFGLRVAGQKTFDCAPGKLPGDLAPFISSKGLDKAPLALVVSRECSISKTFEIPALGQESLDGILRYELEKHLPVPIDDVYYGHQVLGRKGNLYSLMVCAAPKNQVNALREALAANGITPSMTYAWHAGFLNYLACSDKFKKEGGTSVVISGSGQVAIDAYSGTSLVYSKLLRGAQEGANEVLKRELGMAIAFTGAGDEAGQKVFFSGKPGEQITASLPETIKPSLSTLDIKGVEPSFEAAFGGALAAAGKGEIAADLCRPGAEVKDSGYSSVIALCSVVLALVLAVAFSYALRDTLTLRSLERSISALKAGSAAGGDNGAEEHIKDLKTMTGASSPGVLDYIKELTEILPDHTWITSLKYENGVVQMEGLSGDASSLLIQLESSKFLEGFEFTSSVTRVSHGRERFNLKSKVKGQGAGA